MNKVAIYFTAAVVLGVVASSVYKWKYDEWIAIPKAREVFQSKLRDPESAQFRNERLTRTGVLCGEVNSKNGMGGYTGFKEYFTTGTVHYIQGTGSLDEETHDEYIRRLQMHTALLKSYNQIKTEHPDLPLPSDRRIAEQAAENAVKATFKEYCAL